MGGLKIRCAASNIFMILLGGYLLGEETGFHIWVYINALGLSLVNSVDLFVKDGQLKELVEEQERIHDEGRSCGA